MLPPPRILALVLSGWLCASVPLPALATDDYAFHHENVMGTSLELRVRAVDDQTARGVEGRVLAEIDRLSAIFSGYDASSEFRRWQSAPRRPTPVSPELFEVLHASDDWRVRSGGAFDPRVQILTQLWSASAAEGRRPSSEELARARALMVHPAWRLVPETRAVERLSDVPLSLNAIAKGYIVERACNAALAEPGVEGLLLNVGGDLRVCGESRTIGIAPPVADSEMSTPIAVIEVANRAVATSGPTRRGFQIGGRWYSHIFDPRTGEPAAGVLAATVVAARSADADALATILNVVPPDEGLRLATAAGADCLIAAADGRILRSDGWTRLERPAFALAANEKAGDAKAAPNAPSWGDTFELVVRLEINRPDTVGQRYRRPYVAVWVEDKDGFPVRNLALWVSFGGAGPYQWLPDLKRWKRADKTRKKVDKTEMVDAIAEPTKPPGKHSVIWDGKDDRGRPLPPGEYTVFIDAAREHGTYQSIRKTLTIADRPFTEELKGNVEIRSAALEYRRKAAAK